MQGSTHDVARYHPTDVSSFEEGYVAITRARHAARIYIVDGTRPAAESDLTHAPDELEASGLHEISQALERRRSGHMVSDASPRLDALAATLTGAPLDALSARLRQLDRAVAAAPPDATERIDETRQTIETILARQRAWKATRTQSEATLTSDDARDARKSTRDVQRARAALDALDRAHRHAEARLGAAHQQQAQRREHGSMRTATLSPNTNSYNAPNGHAPPRFVSARPPRSAMRPATSSIGDAARDLLGLEPDTQRERLAWRRAVEGIAVFHARYAPEPTLDGDTHDRPLGSRPDNRVARADYVRASDAIDAALSVLDTPSVHAVVDAGLSR